MSISVKEDFKFFHIDKLSKSFGGLKAVDEVSLTVDDMQIVGLIGPNGAGKTSLFNLITGLDTPDSGTVYFQRKYIHKLPAHKIAGCGIARTFQNIRLLKHLTVLENVKTACHMHIRYNLFEAAFRFPKFYRTEKEIQDHAMEFLELFDLHHSAHEYPDFLPYGKRRKLEIARALATEANLLLLDEPAAGLNPSETAELMHLIRKIRDEFKLTIILIEHDMNLVMNLCEKIAVLSFGKKIAEGTADEIRNNPQVIEAYLGTEKEKPQ